MIEGLSCFLERLWGLKLRTQQEPFGNLRVLTIPCKVRGKLLCKCQAEPFFSVTLDPVVSSNSLTPSGCSGNVTESFPSQFIGCLVLHSFCDIFFFVVDPHYFFLNYFSFVLLLNYFYHLINVHCVLVTCSFACIRHLSLQMGLQSQHSEQIFFNLGVFITLLLKHSAWFRTIFYF